MPLNKDKQMQKYWFSLSKLNMEYYHANEEVPAAKMLE